MQKKDLLSTPVVPIDIKAFDAGPILEAMGKTAILVNDVPGFATSRLGVVLGNEAIRMLADGVAEPDVVDRECFTF